MIDCIPEVNWTYRAQLIRVTDGDTVRLLIDNGFFNREAHAIRLLDVNAPEIFTKDESEKQRGLLAKAFVQEWFVNTDRCATDEWPLILVTQKDKQTFNRYIGDIYCVCGNWLNQALRDAGYE